MRANNSSARPTIPCQTLQGNLKGLRPPAQRRLARLTRGLGPRVRGVSGHAQAVAVRRLVPQRPLADERIDAGVLKQRGEAVPP